MHLEIAQQQEQDEGEERLDGVQVLTRNQLRLLAYAPKPFAALSFLSSVFLIYYLFIRHPPKRARMYHRLVLATSICFMPLSVVIFWGTWAMPSDTPYAAGTDATCAIQGFFVIVFALAFPFYYASISVSLCLAVKNNFQEERYRWIERWIHVGAFLPPLSFAIASAVKGWYIPDLTYCSVDLGDFRIVFATVIISELLIAIIAIMVLLSKFESVQRDFDASVGYGRIVETARKSMLKQVATQSGLYFLAFGIGCIPPAVEILIRSATGMLYFNLFVSSRCIFACQGFVMMAIYLTLQRASQVNASSRQLTPGVSENPTVSRIRKNAERRRKGSVISLLKKRITRMFDIYDGAPAEDSPWAQFIDYSERDASSESSGCADQCTVGRTDPSADDDMTTSLLSLKDADICVRSKA